MPKDNLLAIRIQRIVVDGGIYKGPFAIAEAGPIELEIERGLHELKNREIAFLVFYTSTLLFTALTYVLGFRDRRQLLFCCIIAMILVSHLLYSQLIESWGWQSYGTTVVALLIDQCFPVPTLLFLESHPEGADRSWRPRSAGRIRPRMCCLFGSMKTQSINSISFGCYSRSSSSRPLDFFGASKVIDSAIPTLCRYLLGRFGFLSFRGGWLWKP